MPPPKSPSKPFLSFFKSLSCLSLLKQPATIQKSAELEATYSTMSDDDPRYDACMVLYDAGIPCLIWGEDALALYGVPTIILELFLLVHDPERAARSLEAVGYSRTKVNPRFEHIPQLSIHAPRLAIPPKGSNIKGGDLTEVDESNTVGVVLLSAREWKYNLCRDVTETQTYMAPLAVFLDCLIEVYLDLTTADLPLRDHLAVWINYLYVYVKELRAPGFEEQLRPENRQLHFDMLSKENEDHFYLSATRCQQYHQDVREKIRRQEHSPIMAPAKSERSGSSGILLLARVIFVLTVLTTWCSTKVARK